MTTNNIILTGFMGTGKTTVGRIVAARSGRTFVDTDELIVQRAGKSIAAIFAEEGAPAFRRLEKGLARELSQRAGLVIATGGRLMLDAENAAALSPDNLVLCLNATPDEILARVTAGEVRRPLLETDAPERRVRTLLEERAAGYARFPQITTDGKTPSQVADEIVALLPSHQDNGASRPQPHYLPVTHPGGEYQVIVGAGLLPRLSTLAAISDAPFAVVTDSNVGPLYAPLLQKAACVITIPAGEAHKTLATVERLYDHFLAAGLDRSATIVALGGGVVGDVAGFAAASYMRGLPLVQCPTTLLAMVDSSVGGKTGVDLPQGKNLVGAFKQPAAVLADVNTLRTLPPSEFAAGMAEIVKHGIIADPRLLRQLEEGDWRWPPDSRSFDAHLPALIARAVKVKRDVVQDDPFEQGRRAVLNLGHTFGHAIEQVSGYAVRHGEAVAMGLVAAAALSAQLGHAGPHVQERIETLLHTLHLPTRIPTALDRVALLEAMGRDKKKTAGKLRFVLLRAVQDVFITADVPRDAVLHCIKGLQRE